MADQSYHRTGLKVLFLAKWFPNRYDPQMGVFIRKHAMAIAEFSDVALLHIFSDSKMTEKKYDVVVTDQNKVLTVLVYYKKFSSAFYLVEKAVNFFRYWKSTNTGLRYIRKNFGLHDITHAYIMLRPAIVAYYFKIFRNIPYLVSEQWSGYATGKYKSKNWFVRFLTRFVVRKAAAITVVSEFLKKHMMLNRLNGNYAVVPNIVETPVLNSNPQINSKINILLVADLVDEIKNVSGVLKAIAEIAETKKNLELHIIGDGIDKPKLVGLAETYSLLNQIVFFHGLKSNVVVYEMLGQCDFLVMNSNFETFSLICAEAISCGKPVIATRCGGPQEFVTDETGILIDPKNNHQLVEAIRKMMTEHRNYIPEKLISYAQKNFSSEVASQKFYDVYRFIIPSKSK